MNRQIILDTETTGLDVKSGHRVIEIGCVEIVNRKFTGNEYHTYLNPDRESDEGALKVHGLTSEFLSDKPRFSEIYEEFIEFIKGTELLIHNAEFDVGFLDNEIKLISKKLNSITEEVSNVTDTLQIAREKHPGQRNSLDALVNRYEINGYDRELHGALLDSKILGDVYLSMTGGQSNLDFSSTETEGKIPESSSNGKIKRKKLKVIEVSEEDKERNTEYLSRMKEETGIEPLWNKEHE
ncbi:MAG TPA: DNA polymerase III subunit epsilon [SAR86 cluster bacterium]|nr:DNA polymerase III subunit epsilon [SAR86 cluster bacterium]HJM59054.1 DNA polymerase III subunit epsilon [SAR86 cluster bacterium]|tara:strand:+ start:7725 stop:8441 length:717 start_codon:yes stop_codon:yes gene_type:complete